MAYLTHRGVIARGSELFGKAFEHFIYMEILAHGSYTELFYPVSYWRTASQIEVDLVLGDHEVAIEIKSSAMVQDRHLKGIRAFMEEYTAKRYIVVSLDPKARRTHDGIDILPWELFLKRLWNGEIMREETERMGYALGLDFGTESVRALLVNCGTGEEAAEAIQAYEHGVLSKTLPGLQEALPPDFAL